MGLNKSTGNMYEYCVICGEVFYKEDFKKNFNRMKTCGRKECKKEYHKKSSYKSICQDCGTPITNDSKYCNRCKGKGVRNGFFGKTHNDQTKKKLNLFKENKDGRILEYPTEFTMRLKSKIRLRDNNVCVICNENNYKTKVCVHHIDFDKNNNIERNLVSLCKLHHKKAHTNKNEYSVIFNNYINKLYGK